MSTTGSGEKRREQRRSTLKRAHLVFDGTVHDCLVLEMSDTGARVQTGTTLVIPDHVELRLAGGASFPALRRWSRGEEIGLALLTEDGTMRGPSAERTWAAYETLRDGRLDEAVRMLRANGFFDDEALRGLAEEAEAARTRLEQALRERAGKGRG